LGGIAMLIGLQNIGSENFRETLNAVVAHLLDAIAINVAAMGIKILYTWFISTSKETGSNVNPEINHLIAELSKVLRENQEKSDANIDRLDNTLSNFAKHLSEQLIGEIQKVVETLNDKLTEQLGESFRSLDKAVHNLVLWQAEYKDELIRIQAHSKQVEESLEKSSSALANLSDKSSVFTDSAFRLEEISKQIQNQHTGLVRSHESMEASLKSLSGVPEVATRKMNEFIETLSRGASEQQRTTDETGRAIRRNAEDLSQALNRSAGEIEESILNTQKKASIALEDQANKLSDQVYKLEQGLEQALDTALRELTDKLAKIMSHAVNTAHVAYEKADTLERDFKRVN
jgi:ABC-type transporter Mla subunit MlaD